jgi:cytoplasmic tRNA 2-thiolation protein 2
MKFRENGLIKCKKCQLNNGFVLLQRKDVFCRNCFYDYCTHKFRSTIGKSKLVRTADRVLIAFSGGINSLALIHMINEGLNDSQHKKLRFLPSIVYIDGILNYICLNYYFIITL